MSAYKISVNLKKLDQSVSDFIDKLKNNDGPLEHLANWERAIGDAIDEEENEITFELRSIESRYTLANELKIAGFSKLKFITEEEF